MKKVPMKRARTLEDKSQRRLRILDSAKQLFTLHGYQGTTIEMITRNASLTPAAFYLYFQSKTDIYRVLTIEGTDILETMLSESLLNCKSDSTSQIRALAHAYFNFFSLHRDYYNIISILHLGQPEFFTEFNLVPYLEKRALKLLKMLKKIVDDGIRSSEFRKVNSWNTATVLWGMLDGILLLEVKRSTGYINVQIASLMEQMVELVLFGLYAKK